MYFHNGLLEQGSSSYVSINSSNQFMATASNEGNITIRSIAKIQELYENTENKLIPTTNTNIDPLKKYTTQFEVAKTPELDTMKLQQAQQILNTVNVRSRSKITCLRYANLLTNSNLLAAVYKNGEVYIITTPQDPAKCRVQQIFKYTNGQVADFVWSADDQLMAFSTFNNKVIIYDVIYGKVLATLNPHYNIETLNPKGNKIEISATPIKGIAFDRLGNDTLCTLGDDKILNIVKYKLVSDVILGRIFQYEIVQELNDIVSSSKLNKSAIDKISFSPDDDLIVLPNTSKNKAMKLTVLRRDNKTYQLNNELSAVGFKSYMSLFSPRVYQNAKGEKIYVIASASDTTLSIWRTDSFFPLYVDFTSTSTISNLCWSSDGMMLFVTYQNSGMSVAVFNKEEFGKPDDKMETFMRDHPETVKIREKDLNNSELRKLKIKKLQVKNSETPKSETQTPMPTTDTTIGTTNLVPLEPAKSKEKPIYLKEAPLKNKETPTQSKESMPGSEKSTTTEKTEATKQEKTRDSVNEKREKKDTTDTKRPEKAEKVNKAEKTEKVSKVTKVEKTEKAENMEKDNSRKENPKKRPHPTSNYELSSTSVPKDIHLRVAKMSRKESSQNGTTAQAPSKKRKEVEPVEFVGTVIINPQISFSNIRIAIPKLKKAIGYSFIDDETLSLQVTNGNGLESQPTRIALIKQISRVSGSSHYIAVSTQNGQIITYTQSGSRILPALILGSPLSFLELKDEYLLAVTCTGELFVWNLKERKALFKSISLYPLLQPLYSSGQASATNVDGEDSNVNLDGNNLVFLNGELLTKSENVTLCSITSQGIPIVTLSNGNGYLFNKDMNTWSLISDSWWAFGSQYWDSSLSAESTKGIGLLEYMESHTNEEINRRGKAKFFIKISKMMLMREGYENLETIISLNHLENKINFYMSMDDYKNYKLYLIIYAKSKTDRILSSLFNDMDGSICGHAKRELLEEVLLSCSKHREVQDILVPFSESVGILNHKGGSDIDVL
ncbi:hypothetical protein CAS74_004586 [Pichia kudriavzevii]|uniref:Protein HIR n=1 Tax=Pichia kudriavzevii TaxID=4909 RepID=A0A1Z8JID6_PICKU|nr:hypothetical protein CAS74_004586 [Pichia kudriavzevii]